MLAPFGVISPSRPTLDVVKIRFHDPRRNYCHRSITSLAARKLAISTGTLIAGKFPIQRRPVCVLKIYDKSKRNYLNNQ
jgi:hypothetical protein